MHRWRPDFNLFFCGGLLEEEEKEGLEGGVFGRFVDSSLAS